MIAVWFLVALAIGLLLATATACWELRADIHELRLRLDAFDTLLAAAEAFRLAEGQHRDD